jgi:hypothetical protein
MNFVDGQLDGQMAEFDETGKSLPKPLGKPANSRARPSGLIRLVDITSCLGDIGGSNSGTAYNLRAY